MKCQVDNVISRYLVSAEVVIQGKTDIGQRTLTVGTVPGGIENIRPSQFAHPNMTISLNIREIIKQKRTAQCIAIAEKRQ